MRDDDSVKGLAISIHALREEGDYNMLLIKVYQCLFLSTPSVRRATSAVTSGLMD